MINTETVAGMGNFRPLMGNKEGNGFGAGHRRHNGTGYGEGSLLGDGWGAGGAGADLEGWWDTCFANESVNRWNLIKQKGSGAYD